MLYSYKQTAITSGPSVGMWNAIRAACLQVPICRSLGSSAAQACQPVLAQQSISLVLEQNPARVGLFVCLLALSEAPQHGRRGPQFGISRDPPCSANQARPARPARPLKPLLCRPGPILPGPRPGRQAGERTETLPSFYLPTRSISHSRPTHSVSVSCPTHHPDSLTLVVGTDLRVPARLGGSHPSLSGRPSHGTRRLPLLVGIYIRRWAKRVTSSRHGSRRRIFRPCRTGRPHPGRAPGSG